MHPPPVRMRENFISETQQVFRHLVGGGDDLGVGGIGALADDQLRELVGQIHVRGFDRRIFKEARAARTGLAQIVLARRVVLAVGRARDFGQPVRVGEGHQRDLVEVGRRAVRELRHHEAVAGDFHACPQAKLRAVLFRRDDVVVPCKLAEARNVDIDVLRRRTVAPVDLAEVDIDIACRIRLGVDRAIGVEVDQAVAFDGAVRLDDADVPPAAVVVVDVARQALEGREPFGTVGRRIGGCTVVIGGAVQVVGRIGAWRNAESGQGRTGGDFGERYALTRAGFEFIALDDQFAAVADIGKDTRDGVQAGNDVADRADLAGGCRRPGHHCERRDGAAIDRNGELVAGREAKVRHKVRGQGHTRPRARRRAVRSIGLGEVEGQDLGRSQGVIHGEAA